MKKKQGATRRRRQKRNAVVIFLGLMTAGLVVVLSMRPLSRTAAHLADPDNADQVAIGQAVYAHSCANCHGANLEGQANWKQPLPTGGYPAPPHDETGHTWHHPDALLFSITKFGGQATASREVRSQMPAFKEVLTDEEIWAALAYIKSRWPAPVRGKQEQITRKSR